MASMSYCRWHNMVHELRAAKDSLGDALDNNDKWDSEHAKRQAAMELMARMLGEWGYTVKHGELVADVKEEEAFGEGCEEEE